MGHSMGGTMAYVFLRQQTQEWKNKYIRMMFTLGTPFIGTFKYLYGHLFFDDDDTARFTRVVRPAERTYPAFASLIPTRRFWGENTVFISSPNHNYTSSDFEQLFNDIGQPSAYEMASDAHDMIGDLDHPGVEVSCYGAVGVRTLRSVTARTTDLYNVLDREVIYGDGDGYVSTESMKICLKWGRQTNYRFQHRVFNGDHLGLVRDRQVTRVIAGDVSKIK